MTTRHLIVEDVEYLDGAIAANVQQYLDEIDDAIVEAEIAETIEHEIAFWEHFA